MIVELALLGACANPLPADMAADIGAPVDTDVGTVYLYGDTITPAGFVQGTSIIAGAHHLNVLPRTVDDTFYWPGDGYQMPDGRLFVVMGETRTFGFDMFDFEGVDTDAFIISDPANPAAWRWADKIEDGPWGNRAVNFVDGDNLAVTYTFDEGSRLWAFDPADPTAAWVEHDDVDFPDSHGPFVPVQTADGWWGVSWAMWDTMGPDTVAALWHADSATGPYDWVETLDVTGETYDHTLNVVDGHVCWRYSTVNERATTQPITLEER